MGEGQADDRSHAPVDPVDEIERRLRESEERLRLAVAAGEIGTWDYYPTTGALSWDERCKEIHGVARDAPVTYDLFVATIHPDDRRRVEEMVQRMLDPASGGRYVIEYRIQRLLDREERWVSVRGAVLFDDAGRAVRFIGTTQDITDQRRADETRERLLGIVSHDLRGPLSAIKTAASILQRKTSAAPQETVAVIARSVDRMAAMISQLLDFTRVRLGGGVALDAEVVDAGVLARQIVDEVTLAHGGRGPILDVRGDCVGAWDRSRLGQVIANLLHNAMLHGAPERPVTVTLRGEPNEVTFEVHNEGPPIAPEILPVIFDPFRRGAPSRHRQGLGLGLYITHQIVLAFGGRIEVLSTAEAGTTFRIHMPRAAPAAPAPEGTPPAKG